MGDKAVRFFAVTNRAQQPGDVYGDGRTRDLAFQEYNVSIPPGHKSGQIEWSNSRSASRAKDFVTLERDDFSEAEFQKQLNQMSASGKDTVYLFVHGYNYSYQEAVLRMAQLAHDSNYKGVGILYSWPSEAKVLGYWRDRESSVFSRDRLLRLMAMIAATPGVRKIHILGHSMGAYLTMETLRTAALMGNPNFNGKLTDVMLAAPDIDVDVFTSELDVVGRRTPPIVLVVNTRDRALYLSKIIARDGARLGNVDPKDPRVRAMAQKYGLVILDTSDINSPDDTLHNNFATRAVLQDFMRSDQRRSGGLRIIGVINVEVSGHGRGQRQ